MELFEAFKALDALNEDTFSVSDDGIAKLDEFQNNDEITDEIEVIDADAETEEDLEDSYVGKVILDCTVCHSKIYKDKEEVELNEDETLANVGEECPFCYTSDGFKVIGQVADYSAPEKEEPEDNDGEEPEDIDTEDKKDDSEDQVEESLSVSPTNDDIRDDKSESPTDTLAEAAGTLERPMSALGGTLSNVMTAHKDELASVYDKSSALSFLDSIEPEVKNKGYLGSIKEKIARIPDSRVVQFLYNIILKGDGMGTKMESINEDVSNVNVETDDSIVNVSSDDNGKVTVTTEPKTADEAPVDGAEVIAPVDSELEAEIKNNDFSEEEVDIDVDEFDEESFDELGESYFKKVYENVDSFKTSEVSTKDNKIFVEGVVKFDSGNEKKTCFIFEAKDYTKTGKYRFIGENVNLTKGKKAFTVIGKMHEGKFISESLRYSYLNQNESGAADVIRGSVKRG